MTIRRIVGRATGIALACSCGVALTACGKDPEPREQRGEPVNVLSARADGGRNARLAVLYAGPNAAHRLRITAKRRNAQSLEIEGHAFVSRAYLNSARSRCIIVEIRNLGKVDRIYAQSYGVGPEPVSTSPRLTGELARTVRSGACTTVRGELGRPIEIQLAG